MLFLQTGTDFTCIVLLVKLLILSTEESEVQVMVGGYADMLIVCLKGRVLCERVMQSAYLKAHNISST